MTAPRPGISTGTRDQKLAALIARSEERRSQALNDLDAVARQTNTFGSPDHRSGRDRVERASEQELKRYAVLSDEEIERELKN